MRKHCSQSARLQIITMGQSLTFIDCSSCGKRIRSNALKCHHCHKTNVPGNSHILELDASSWVTENVRKTTSSGENDDSDSHMALESGGYNDADHFDYDKYLAEEFPEQVDQKPQGRKWIWFTAWLLIFATLLPYLYYVVIFAR